jgi:lysine 2,3-aminomutase
MKTASQTADEPPDPGSSSFATPASLPPQTISQPSRLQKSIAKRDRARFRVSERSAEFLARFYPAGTVDDWNDWRWQNRNRVRTLADLGRMIELSGDETAAIARHTGALPVGITPYYASLLDPRDPAQALRRTVVPVLGEYLVSRGENDDPLGEDTHSPVPGLVHRYPDRVLLLVTNFCSVYCRYCTRARMVGSVGERSVKKSDIEAALEYIERTPAVRDVLISGGDPLSLDDDRLEYILKRLRKIPHVEFVRIGSKQPVVQPMRITPTLTRILKRYHPLSSPKEQTNRTGCSRAGLSTDCCLTTGAPSCAWLIMLGNTVWFLPSGFPKSRRSAKR